MDQSEFRPTAEASLPVFISTANANEMRSVLAGIVRSFVTVISPTLHMNED